MRNDLPIESRVIDIINLIDKENTYLSTKEIVKKYVILVCITNLKAVGYLNKY